MQILTFIAILLLSCAACQSGGQPTRPVDELQDQVSEIRKSFAPDRRTDRVEVSLEQRGDTTYLVGYTTRPEALRELEGLAAKTRGTVNEVQLLADGQAEPAYGLIRVSVANIRTEPSHSSELTSQALLGTPVALLDYDHGWYLIRTPDRYLAYLEEGAIAPLMADGLVAYLSSPENLRTCVSAQSFVRVRPGEEKLVSELVAGNLLQVTGTTRGAYSEVVLPDDRQGWVPGNDLMPYATLANPDRVDIDAILQTAYEQVGRPYLWGGTSPKAMDCSGFTKTAYYLNGYVIPRDASQQVHAGTEVPLDEDFSQLQRGDLLFFGNLRENGSQRITHVGFYLGSGRFLHAGADNGYITENSLIRGARDYAEHRLKSLLRARRLREGDAGVVPVAMAFEGLYTKSSSR